ncbi:glycerophosphodiester phosphodiesterase [Halobellus marinus]|uniref:glycerophosphodiester phosphodiesterase n=1 Tax=Halobellus TaxID=1073986 RepID=UPI0028AE47E6|nr:glycerophosphodiester phosphodiesterase family protein [Halobellus sp. DFY28]
MRVIAHRGCLAQYPENTRYAFRESARVVDMIETDVRRCGSGELVVFHDETLDRVTDRTGAVESLSLAELREVSILDSGESIPRLVELFETVPPTVGLNLELKGRDLARDTIAIADQYDHDVIISSFRPEDLAVAGDTDATALAYLFAADDTADFDVADALDTAVDLGCEYAHPEVALCLETDVVGDAHARSLAVNAWTAETETEVRALRARGVDGIVIEDCDLAAVCRGE